MDNLIFSLNATIPIFLTMVIGYLFKQIKLLDDSFVTVLNKFNFKITLPMLLFLDLYQADFYQVWDGKYVFFCFIVTLICISVISLFSMLLVRDKSLIGEFIQASYRGSAAVLGLAFIQNIYGQATVTPLMIIGTVPLYNVMAVIVLSFTAPSTTDTSESTTGRLNKKMLLKSIKGIFTNPIIIGIALGLLASLSRIQFPAMVTKTINNFAVLASPLALIGLGAGFEGKKALKKIKPTIFASLIRLMVQPALFLPLAAYMGFGGEKMVALLIMLGAPTTASCYIMARNMGHDGVLSSSVVVTTTFLSSVTLTFWLFVMRSFGVI